MEEEGHLEESSHTPATLPAHTHTHVTSFHLHSPHCTSFTFSAPSCLPHTCTATIFLPLPLLPLPACLQLSMPSLLCWHSAQAQHALHAWAVAERSRTELHAGSTSDLLSSLKLEKTPPAHMANSTAWHRHRGTLRMEIGLNLRQTGLRNFADPPPLSLFLCLSFPLPRAA